MREEMKMTDVRIIGFKNAQEYIEFRINQWLNHHSYIDLNYYIRFEAGHNATDRTTFFELATLQDSIYDLEWCMDWCEGEVYVDLNSVYIFEEREIAELIETHIELYEYITEKRGTNQ